MARTEGGSGYNPTDKELLSDLARVLGHSSPPTEVVEAARSVFPGEASREAQVAASLAAIGLEEDALSASALDAVRRRSGATELHPGEAVRPKRRRIIRRKRHKPV